MIAGTEKVRELMSKYLELWRPLVALEDEDKSAAMLFLDTQGKWDKRLERHVTTYFLQSVGLRITTTTMRKMMDTAADDMHRRGLLTTEHVAAVHFVAGHSAQTSADYYLQ